MNSFLKQYGSTLALLLGVIVGGAIGVLFPSAAQYLKPLGDIFLNFLFVMVVPLVFFSITVSISKMKDSGTMGRVFGVMMGTFVVMSLIAGIIAFFSLTVFDPLKGIDRSLFTGGLQDVDMASAASVADVIVGSLTVSDFTLLFSKSNLLPLIIFAAILGISASAAGEKGKMVIDLCESGSEVIDKMMGIMMKAAPVGLGCFFAYTVANVGSQLVDGYIRTLVLYIILSVLFFFIINPLYAFVAGGWKGLRSWWSHILPPSITAFITTSSALAVPGNIEAARKMGADPAIAESVIPFGTNVHKDGSVITGVIKAAFLMSLFGRDFISLEGAGLLILIGILSSIVLAAVAGGAMTGELLICSLLGFPPEMAGLIIIIGTIVDMPATLVNSSSNVAATMLVNRFCGNRNAQQ